MHQKNACGQTYQKVIPGIPGWYTLLLVYFNRFCQHSSITDADEICDMAAVRDLSTGDVVFKSV